MTMKPVTELLQLVTRLWMGQGGTSAEWADVARRLASLEGQAGLADVLDLVATLPPERLDLVRWVAGLDTADALAVLDALVDAHGRESSPAVARLRDSLMAALSGGEGDKKCGECAGTGKVKRLEVGGSVRVVKYDPCPKCAEGEGGAKDERWSCPGIHRWVGGGDYGGGDAICGNCGVDLQDDAAQRPCGEKALEKEKPKPTILPAGKPPPFLRVGMVLCVPGAPCGDIRIRGEEVDGRVQVSGIDGSTWLASVSRFRAEWVLAEHFTVEGES